MKNKKKSTKVSRSVQRRTGLSELYGQTVRFEAVVGRPSMTSWKSTGLRQETLELRAIYCLDNPGRLLADHIWVKMADFDDRSELDTLLKQKGVTKKIVFTGTVYGYCEPFGGRGFHGFSGYRYSIGNLELLEASAAA